MKRMKNDEQRKEEKPRVNLRLLLFCTLGVIFGIVLYLRCRFGGASFADFLLFGVLLVLAYFPASFKRVLFATLPFLFGAALGVLVIHLYTQNYLDRIAEGEYTVTGTVTDFSPANGYSYATLTSLVIEGEETGGKMSVTLSGGEVRTGDRITFAANVKVSPVPAGRQMTAEFIGDIRYRANAEEYEIAPSSNPFLRLNGVFYDTLHGGMEKNGADVSYALLTGNSAVLDSSLSSAVRYGGIAHIFAVSGLHIGILYAAVSLLFRFLKKFRVLPATAVSLLYCAVCGFSVSSLRAVIMCAAIGVHGALGRKHDFLEAISLAAILILCLFPAQFFAAGFRLSFGACVGLALFAGSFSRALKRLPALVKNYLSANCAVQLFTFPVLLGEFGYFSVWGMLFNFFLIPLLPVLFLGVLIFTLLAAAIPSAAAVFLAVPAGMVAAFLFLLSLIDVSFSLTGFSLGAGSAVFLAACVLLSERVRMSGRLRAAVAVCCAVLFTLCVLLENAVFSGCKIITGENMALLRTSTENVLIVGDARLWDCERLLARNYGGELTAVIVLTKDELKGINVAAFLPAQRIYAYEEIPTGLQETEVCFARRFTVGDMEFYYEGAEKLSLLTQGLVTEFDFINPPALHADLFVEKGGGGLIFYLKNGIIHAR